MVRTTLITILIASMAVSVAHGKRRKSRHGKLMVDSGTVGATVYVDGKRKANLPMKKPLRFKAGKHTIRVSLMGHADYIDRFSIRRGRTTKLSIELVPMTGVLRLRSRPKGALAVLDGGILGRTPVVGELEPGNHQLEVRRDGYRSHRRQIELLPGEEMVLEIALTPEPAVVGGVAWHKNKWVWIAAAGVAVIGALATYSLSSDSANEPTPGHLVRIRTTD
jgi:hypothetical protein